MLDNEDIDIDIDMDIEDVEDEDEEDEREDEDEDDDDEDKDDTEDTSYMSKFRYIVIKNEDRRTSNMISLFELVNVIGTRAQMIDSSTSEMIYVPLEGLKNTIEIAEAEIKLGKCPLSIERIVYQDPYVTKVELWKVNELVIPDIF